MLCCRLSRVSSALCFVMLPVAVAISTAAAADSGDPIGAIEAVGEVIPADRLEILERTAEAISKAVDRRGRADVTFICTHNSRRSQFAQVWMQVAAAHVGLGGVIRTHSGGTEATACNTRTIAALRRIGFDMRTGQTTAKPESPDDNPKYTLVAAKHLSSPAESPVTLYSKRFADDPNPESDFIAVMCCGDADEKCPEVAGAVDRIALHYVDPKVADGRPDEAATYDRRCRQIGTEMLWIAKRIAELRKRDVASTPTPGGE